MGTPQSGIFAIGTQVHLHLEFDIVGNSDFDFSKLNECRLLANTLSGVNIVIGLGKSLLNLVPKQYRPLIFEDFETIKGIEGLVVPKCQHDLWIWLHGGRDDALFDLARKLNKVISQYFTLAHENRGFQYHSSQDLTKFEDGSENPPLDEAIFEATLRGIQGDGGSIALLQKWKHDLDKFENQTNSEQELVFGRTLIGSVELDESAIAKDSHIKRVVISNLEGEELEIFRRSAAFGGLVDHGLMFLAFSADQGRLNRMLKRMLGLEDGISDRLMRFSEAVQSAYYFAPPIEAFG